MPADPVQQYPKFLLVGCNCNIQYCWCDEINTYECWPSLVKQHVCWFSTTILNTHDVKDVGYDELVALRGRCLVKLQQICLRTWYYSMKHASWSIGNQREKLLDRCPSIRHADYNNAKLYQPRLLHCQYKIHAM